MTPAENYGINVLWMAFRILPAIWSGKINNDRKSIETYIDKKYLEESKVKKVPSKNYKSEIDDFIEEYGKFLKKNLPLKYKIFCLYKLYYNHDEPPYYIMIGKKTLFREFKEGLLSKFSRKNEYHLYQKILVESGEDFSIFNNKKED